MSFSRNLRTIVLTTSILLATPHAGGCAADDIRNCITRYNPGFGQNEEKESKRYYQKENQLTSR